MQGSCKNCKWLNICHGGCLHDGFLKSGDFRSKTFLCSAYKKIFAHIEKRMQEVSIQQRATKKVALFFGIWVWQKMPICISEQFSGRQVRERLNEPRFSRQERCFLEK
jgi:hypothetical protein